LNVLCLLLEFGCSLGGSPRSWVFKLTHYPKSWTYSWRAIKWPLADSLRDAQRFPACGHRRVKHEKSAVPFSLSAIDFSGLSA